MVIGNRPIHEAGGEGSCEEMEEELGGGGGEEVSRPSDHLTTTIHDSHNRLDETVDRNTELPPSPSTSYLSLVDEKDGLFTSLEDLEGTKEGEGDGEGENGTGAGEKDKQDGGKDEGNLQKAPDGGYGWVVAFAVFLNHVIHGGLGRSDGLFFLQFQSRFNTSAQLAAWPVSLNTTLNWFTGPVCGAVSNRYSVRAAFIIGTTLVFFGFIMTAFSPSVYFLFVSHTLFSGFGRGLLSGFLLLNLYFDKHRSLAIGLGSSGVGIGALWIIPLTQWLFDTYGFTGAFIILSGIVLFGMVVGMLLRPLSMHQKFLALKKKRNGKGILTEEGEELATFENGCPQNNNTLEQNKNERNQAETNGTHTNGKPHEPITPADEAQVISNGNGESSTAKSNRMHRWESVFKSSLKILFPVEHSRKGNAKKQPNVHWHLLKCVPFLIFCFSMLLFVLAFKTAFTFLPAIAIANGLSKTEAALVLTVSGACDTFGRLAFGVVMDFKPLRPLRPYLFNLLLFGIAGASFIIPALESFASFCVVSSLYGFMTGAFISQKMVVLVDTMGREVLPSSLGVLKCFQGLGTLIGPPLSGALRDVLGNFDSSFFLGGGCMVASGCLLFVSTLMFKLKGR